MGQYYRLVNIDKREYLDPDEFDCGVKLMSGCSAENEFPLAIMRLLATDWWGDRLAYIGGYAEDQVEEGDLDFPGAELVRVIRRETAQRLGTKVYECHNLTNAEQKLARPAHKVFQINAETGWLEFIDVPGHDGMIPVDAGGRFVVNLDRREYYDRERLPFWYSSKDEDGNRLDVHFDPLAILISVGNGLGGGSYYEAKGAELVGSWACQRLAVTDCRLRDCKEIENPFEPGD